MRLRTFYFKRFRWSYVHYTGGSPRDPIPDLSQQAARISRPRRNKNPYKHSLPTCLKKDTDEAEQADKQSNRSNRRQTK